MEELYRQYVQIVYRFLVSACHDPHLAEDLTQETFLRAWESLERFDHSCRLSTWLCQIARHVWMHELRKKKYRRETSLEQSLEQNPGDFICRYLVSRYDTEQSALNHINSQKALAAIRELSPIVCQVLLYRLVGELSFQEIGDILGQTENWARVTFFRGRKKLKEALEHEIG